MNIVLASDNGFVQHCAVTMLSILKNNEDVSFYLLTEGLSLENENKLQLMTKANGGTLKILIVPSEILKRWPMPSYMSDHISVATYYRLFVAELLPNYVNKAIYMDCDIVVRKNIQRLWDTNVEDKALAAVYQYNEWGDWEHVWDRLEIPREYGYFNAGVILVNLEYWRRNRIQEKLFNYIEKNFEKIHSHDQDTLNAVLYKEIFPLDVTWNLMPFFFDQYSKWTFPIHLSVEDIEKAKRDPAVIHFVYKPKPWEFACIHPYRSEYSKYLGYTPWRGAKPSFDFRDYWRFKIRSKMIFLGGVVLRKVGVKK